METNHDENIIVCPYAGLGLLRGGIAHAAATGVSIVTGGTAVVVVGAAYAIYDAGCAFDW